MTELRITLDRQALKALASDTRLEILKLLDRRQMTVTELAKGLSLNKATVFEHLERLRGAELVRKDEEGERKWVYYSLTWRGRRILHPERITIALLLSTALGALLSAGVFLAHFVAPGSTFDALGSPEADQSAESLAAPAERMAAEGPAADPVFLYLAIAFFALVAILCAAAYLTHRRASARPTAGPPGPG